MAPRRSGGGGSSWSSGSSSTCPDAFSDWTSQANLAYYILFLIMYIGISFALCVVRKRSGPGKKLIGAVYIFSLMFAIVSLILDFVNLILNQCDVAVFDDYMNVSIASTVLYHLTCLGLLFVVLYQLNHMLRKRLGSAVTKIKTILLITFGIMAALYIAYIALISYLSYNGVYYYGDETDNIVSSTWKVAIAARSLYLVCVLVSTGLAAMTISSMRRAHMSGGDLIGWVFVLHTFMIIWAVLAVVVSAPDISHQLSTSAGFAISYVLTFFQALSFIALLAIAKHVCWRDNNAFVQQVYPPVMHEQTAYGYGGATQPEFVAHAK